MDFKVFNYILIGFSSLITTSLSYFPFQSGPIILDPYGSFFASSELNPFGVQQQKFVHNMHTGKVPKIYNYFNKPTMKHKLKYYENPIPKSFNPMNHELLAAEMLFENSKNHELMNIPIKVQPKRKYRKIRIPKYKNYNYQKPMRPTLVNKGQHLLHHQLPMKTNQQKNNIKNFNRKPVIDGPTRHSRYYKEKYHETPDKITLNGEVSISSDDAAADDYVDIAKPRKVYHLPPPLKPLPQYEFDEPKMKHQDNNFFKNDDSSNENNRPGFYEIDAPKNLHINAPKIIDANRDRLFEYPKIVHSDDPFFNNKNNEDSLRSRWKIRHEKSKSKLTGNNNNNLLGIGNNNREVGASLSVQSDNTDGPNMMMTMGKVFDDPLPPSTPDKKKLHKTAENYEENYRSQIKSQLDDSNPFSYTSSQRDDDPSFVPNSIQSNKPSVKPWVRWPQYQKPNNTRLDLDTNEDDFDNNFANNNNNNKAKEDKSSSNFYNDSNDKEDYEYDDEHSQENSEKPAKAQTPLDQTSEPLLDFPVSTLPPPPPDDPIWENPFEKEILNNGQRNNLVNDESQEDQSSGGGWSSSGIPGHPGKDYPTLQDHPVRTRFSCSGKPHGFYSDVNQKCQAYHQCSPQGSQRFVCPNGTLFSQESLVCEWWYNVNCDDSEKLYHKNAQLYLPNSDSNNKGDKNKNKDNDREFTRWNHHNSDNNNNNNNNHHNQQMYNSDHNTNNYDHRNNNNNNRDTTSTTDRNNVNYNYDKYKNNGDGYRNYNSNRNSFKSSSPEYHDSHDNSGDHEDDSHLSEDIAESINKLFRV